MLYQNLFTSMEAIMQGYHALSKSIYFNRSCFISFPVLESQNLIHIGTPIIHLLRKVNNLSGTVLDCTIKV